jgi:predicted extracellular nuclease
MVLISRLLLAIAAALLVSAAPALAASPDVVISQVYGGGGNSGATLFGHRQPPVFGSEDQRHAQATEVKSFVDDLLGVDRKADVVVLGDLNDFEFSRTADILAGDGALVDLPRTLPVPERYTYVFEGNSEVLDHILLSDDLARKHYDYDVVHVNSEFADQASDHEPQVVRLNP